jgi:hypothetical protein
VSLYDAELKAMTGVRAARWTALGIASFTALLMIALSGDRGGIDVDQAVIEGLAWLSWWVGGFALMSAAPDWFAFQRPVSSLARERGFSGRTLAVTPAAALVRRLWVLIGAPAGLLAVLGLALTNEPALLLVRAALIPAVVGYALLLALVLTGLTRWSAALSPRFARTWLLIFILGPHVARELWPSTPSVVAVFQWLLTSLRELGTLT